MTWTVVSIHTMISKRGVVPSISLHNTTDQGGRESNSKMKFGGEAKSLGL